MKLFQVRHKSIFLFETNYSYIQLWTDWIQLFNPRTWNWWTFKPICIEIDLDWQTANHEVVLSLLGFECRVLVAISTKRSRAMREKLDKEYQEYLHKNKI